ncbi:transglutaminase domain-containing protein [[Clostridium] spiroforme]|nr:transglutaminase domain-containing protein [Thomasclavelia spiroformis]MBM6879516.1 transglutaminase domain-containing protein [Thomasclavelia spiroformis]
MNHTHQPIFQKYFIHILNIVMIILGYTGLMVNYYQSLAFPAATIISIVLLMFWGIYLYYYHVHYGHMPMMLCLKMAAVLFMMMILLSQNEFRYFIVNLKDVIVNDYFLSVEELVPVSLPVRSIFYQLMTLWLGLPVIYLIVSSLCSQRLTLLKMVLIIILFMFPLLIRHSLASRQSYCLIIFIGYQFLSAVILKNQPNQHFLKAIMTCFLCVMTLLSSMYLEGNPLFQQGSASVLMQLIDQVIQGKSHPLGIISQTGMSSDIDGTLPTGNIRLNRNTAVTVQAEIPFSSYLRAYSLASYQDNEWHEAKEDYPLSQSLTTYSDYLRLNYSASLETVKITSQTQYDFQLIPYYFTNYADQSASYSMVYDSYVEQSNKDMIVIYDYEEKRQSSVNENSYIISGQYDQGYENYVYENYMDVPEELYDQLKNLMIEYGVYSSRLGVDETIAQIQQLLSAQAQYDLNAGTLPLDKDFVEYFLFENKKGSCTHFATAGALLLRQKGIPTRFVRGYIMKASDFHEGKANIPQYRSHAWIEVYKDDIGWVPYEMTPSGNIETMSDTLDQTVSQNQQNTASNDPSDTTGQQDTSSDTTDDPLPDEESESSFQYIEPLIGLVGIVVLLMIYRYLTTHWLQIKTKHMTYKQRVLIYYKVIWKLSPRHHIDEGYLKDLTYKAKYSLHEITDEEWEKFYDCYLQWLDQYDAMLKWYQKLIFRYIKGYK